MTTKFSMDTLSNVFNKSDKEKGVKDIRYGWDPNGNQHCFQKGLEAAWWDYDRRAVQVDHLTAREIFTAAGGNFEAVLGKVVTQLDDGTIVVPDISTYNVVRADRPNVVLQTDVSKSYNLMPYQNIVLIPDDVTIKLSDFSDGSEVKSFFADKDIDEDVEISVNEIITPASCSVWQNGKQITFQYLLGTFEPRPGDTHRVYLTVESAFDGKKTTRFYLTIVRIVCQNTQLHAEQEGWAPLTSVEKARQRIRRTSLMDKRIEGWRNNIGDTLIGAATVRSIFTQLAETKFASRDTRRDKVVEFVNEMFELKGSKTKTGNTRENNQRDAIVEVMFNSDLGGDRCETFFDLWNGVTAWKQHFAQVNGLDTIKEAEERRYYNVMTQKTTQEELNNQLFVLIKRAGLVA